jgi:hypothetical protein
VRGRTAARSLDAVFESSDVERFGWIGSWSSRYILLWIAKDQKTAPMRSARAKQARDARSGKRTKLTHVNAFRRFRAQHYVEKLRGSSPATALLRKGTTQ